MGSSISHKESHSSQQISELKNWASKLGFAIVHFETLRRKRIELNSLPGYRTEDEN